MSRVRAYLTLVRPTTWAAIGFAAAATVTASLYFVTGPTGKAWLPNVSVGLVTIALTITFVQWIVSREERASERSRVQQALGRISGTLFVLLDFVLHDYLTMHPGDSYREPPHPLRDLLTHFEKELDTKETPLPKDLFTLGATESISHHLQEQIDRHERVLDHDFIAAAYRFMRSELMSRNMYRDPGPHYSGEDGWKRSALEGLVGSVQTFLVAFEPYARRYLGHDWKVELSDDNIARADLTHQMSLRDCADDPRPGDENRGNLAE